MKRAYALSIIAILLAVTRPALAGDDVLDGASEARFKEGVAFAKAGKYEEARAAFLQTHVLVPDSPKVLLNLAIAEHGTKHYVEALSHLHAYFANPKTDPKKAAEVRRTLFEELWQLTGHLRIRAERGDRVVLDGGVVLGNAPFADLVDVSAGAHRVTAGERTGDVTVGGGETKDVVLVAAPASTAAAGQSASQQPVLTPPPEEPKRATTRLVVAGGLLGAGLVGIGVGAGFSVASSAHVDDARGVREKTAGNVCADVASASCREWTNHLDTANSQRAVSYVSFAAGGVFVLSAVVAYWLWPRTNSPTTGWIAPAFTADHALLTGGGNF